MKKIFVLVFALLSISAYAQTEKGDTIAVSGNKIRVESPNFQAGGGTNNSGAHYDYTPPTDISSEKTFDLSKFRISGFEYTPGVAPIKNWGTGGIYATGSSTEYVGLMNVQSGSLNLWQQAGNFTFNVYGDAAKYGFYRGLSTTYGVGGSMTYDINDRIGITAFGSYTTTPGFGTPGMAGYINTTNFGGYLNYKIGDRWGVKVGAQTYRSIMNNGWQTQPMVIPYFKLGNGSELGIDVGGILYNILKNTHSGPFKGGNPTIAPPTMIDMH